MPWRPRDLNYLDVVISAITLFDTCSCQKVITFQHELKPTSPSPAQLELLFHSTVVAACRDELD